MPVKKIPFLLLIPIIVFTCGFLLSSGFFTKFAAYASGMFLFKVERLLYHNLLMFPMYPYATHYFIIPDGASWYFFAKGLTPGFMLAVIPNIFYNALFQPLILCVFTPQVILNYALFPFFLYGAFKYFKKVPVMIIGLLAIYAYVALYSSIIEPLIRHRISCELIYILIGLAGFINLTTEKLS